MSGICTAAPPHLDAHDKNSMYSYLYWSELGLNRRHAWINDIFAIFNMITLHKTEIARQNNTLSIFFETPPKFHKSHFQGSPCLIKSRAPPSSPVVHTLMLRSVRSREQTLSTSRLHFSWRVILIELFADSLFIDPISSPAALQQITDINKSKIKHAEIQVHLWRSTLSSVLGSN